MLKRIMATNGGNHQQDRIIPASINLKALQNDAPDIGSTDPHRTLTMWNVSALPLLLNRHERFFVVDAGSEKYLSGLRAQLDAECDEYGRESLLHVAYRESSVRPMFLRRLLQLGVDPDVLDGDALPPAFCKSIYSLEPAEVLGMCRPDMAVYGRSAAEALAKHQRNVGLRRFWKKLVDEGFPSLAQLAHEKHWFAVQNLTRRHVVKTQEALYDTYEGQTAIEWVQHHEYPELEEELRYLLLKADQKIGPKPQGSESDQQEDKQLEEMLFLNIAQSNESMAAMKGRMAAVEAENKGLKGKLEQQGNALKAIAVQVNGLNKTVEQGKLEKKDELELLRSEFQGLRDHVTGVLPSIVATTVSATLATSVAAGRGQNHQQHHQ